MGRTNVVIDEELIDRVMKLYDLPSKRAAVHFALRAVAGDGAADRRSILALEGAGWNSDLDQMRAGWVPPEW